MFQGMHYVYEVYKEMSFSKAARNLFISQPSLSAAVKKAEKQIGFPIFDRSSNHIQLTELGKEYIRSIEIIMDVETGFQNYINDMKELKSGTIAIGGTNLFASYVLPPLLSRFTEQYPQVQVDLVEATTSQLTDRLFSGSLDLLIDNKNMDPAVYQKSFFCEEHLLLAVPIRLAVNEKMKNYALTASDIRENRHLNSRADRICHNAHVLPKIKLELDQQITAYNLSRYGMGISFCSDTLVRHVPDDEGLVYYKLDHKDALREVNFYYKRGRYMPRVVSTFLEMI